MLGRADRYQRGRGFFVNGQLIEEEPLERGGWTKAMVTLNIPPTFGLHIKFVNVFESTVTAISVCSEMDAFCYRLGNKIAVGRLRKQLALWGLEDAVAWP